MPTEEELKKLPVEHTPKEKIKDAEDEGVIKKAFPFMIRKIEYFNDDRPDFLRRPPAIGTMEKR